MTLAPSTLVSFQSSLWYLIVNRLWSMPSARRTVAFRSLMCTGFTGDPELLDDGFEDFDCVDSTVTKISDIVPKEGKQIGFVYEYDFGDGWEHEVLFEVCLPAEKSGRYPLCVEGERSCPPEDVGGVWGYTEFLEALADPKHEQHEEFKEWAGPFDPEHFDSVKLTKKMLRGLPDWCQNE